MKQIQDLGEIMSLVRSQQEKEKIFISQQEKNLSDMSLGDEDTGGAAIEIEVKILMPEEAVYFDKVYTHSIEYEEAVSQIKEFEQLSALQKISPEDMEKKYNTPS
ncbi:hypothetical protein [Bacillus sp. PK3_68]|uniref:hypothetical protein n=1 Tax=Bacillus sp. PK3_68 TaxID=2027408 RepID=UPI000E7602C6|nr:hypothetical protein [Bacillus sp. PK3_68]RJS61941.1 hypothetical protein CJ483_19395 [Bacillus sp. PK3_68]